jgi:hypothetical protein
LGKVSIRAKASLASLTRGFVEARAAHLALVPLNALFDERYAVYWQVNRDAG